MPISSQMFTPEHNKHQTQRIPKTNTANEKIDAKEIINVSYLFLSYELKPKRQDKDDIICNGAGNVLLLYHRAAAAANTF